MRVVFRVFLTSACCMVLAAIVFWLLPRGWNIRIVQLPEDVTTAMVAFNLCLALAGFFLLCGLIFTPTVPVRAKLVACALVVLLILTPAWAPVI
jgi:hypothetical protein